MGRKRRKNRNGRCSHQEEGRTKQKEKEPVPSTSVNSSSWVELPELALDSIIHRLVSVPDLVSFTSTCRSWRSFPLPSLTSVPPLLFLPLLSSTSSPLRCPPIWYRSVLKTLTLDPFHCKLPSQELARLKFLGYSHGLLLLSGPHGRLLFADVFSGEVTTTPFPPQSPKPRGILRLTDASILLYGTEPPTLQSSATTVRVPVPNPTGLTSSTTAPPLYPSTTAASLLSAPPPPLYTPSTLPANTSDPNGSKCGYPKSPDPSSSVVTSATASSLAGLTYC